MRGQRAAKATSESPYVADAFRGLSPVARHRLVYAAVGDLMKTDIHALTIEASPPPA